MPFITATPDQRAVMLAAVSAGLISDTFPARSRLLNDIKRSADGVREVSARIAAKVAATARPTAVPVLASSVKSTDKPRPPATVGNGTGKRTTTKVTTERIKPHTQSAAAQVAAVQAGQAAAALLPQAAVAAQATPTEHPRFGPRAHRAAGAGAGHSAATITAASGVGAQRATQVHQQPSSVHAAGATTQLIQAERQRQTQQVMAAQHSRAGHYDRHNLIAAAGDNVQRLAHAQRAELDRMARERAGRNAG